MAPRDGVLDGPPQGMVKTLLKIGAVAAVGLVSLELARILTIALDNRLDHAVAIPLRRTLEDASALLQPSQKEPQ